MKMSMSRVTAKTNGARVAVEVVKHHGTVAVFDSPEDPSSVGHDRRCSTLGSRGGGGEWYN